jgi:hypothetical protein
MKVDCPKGWKQVMKIGNIIIEDSTVTICDFVCDSADLCGITSCEFYDTSREATRRYIRALNREHTLEGLMERHARPN